jgi:two-component system response regulator YesN
MNYFSEVVQLKLKWVRLAFFSALFVGLTALISGFLPFEYGWIFTLVFTLFYFGFAQEYIKYNKVYHIIESAISIPHTETIPIPGRHLMKADWEYYKKEILSNKFYCKAGVNIEDLAKKLNIGRTTLSNLINREEGINFNSWINRLRIEDAKSLMMDNPDFTIAIISEMVGYTEQANFSRQFKQITGESPLYWRKKAAS